MTKAKVIAMANKLGCTIELDKYHVAVVAPKGFIIGDHMHSSVFEFCDRSKADIWQTLAEEMQELRPCEYEDCFDFVTK
jgi:hypothetical protein